MSILILRETGNYHCKIDCFRCCCFFVFFSYIWTFNDIQMVYSVYSFKVWGSSAGFSEKERHFRIDESSKHWKPSETEYFSKWPLLWELGDIENKQHFDNKIDSSTLTVKLLTDRLTRQPHSILYIHTAINTHLTCWQNESETGSFINKIRVNKHCCKRSFIFITPYTETHIIKKNRQTG